MSDVLFGQSYYLRFDPKLWQAMQPYPPLGTLYAAAAARARGYDVALFDAMLAESEQEWEAALARETPRIAVLYEDNFNYLSKMCLLRMRAAAFTMIEMARARGCIVIVCGADATDHAVKYLERGADFILIGEGDATLLELLDALATTDRRSQPANDRSLTTERRAEFERIQGLVFLADEAPGDARPPAAGEIPLVLAGGPAPESAALPESPQATVVRTARRPDIKDLDALPFPAWDLVDVERYRAIWMERHGYFSMNMVTTRGCPYHCNWCAKPIWGQRYNVRSPENVVAELAWLKRTYRPDHIWFADDIVGLKPGWMKRFAELVEEADARVPFKCLSRADLLLRGGAIEGLARAGCRIVWIGAESGSQRILDAMEKGTRVEQIEEAARRLREAGVQVGFFLQFGYPGETRADIEKTLALVRRARPDDIGMSVSYPLPGTPFYERVRNELGQRQNWEDSNDLAMLYRGPFPTAFYRQLHRVLHHEFRARKALAAGLGAGELKKRARALAASLYHATRYVPARLRLEWLARAPHSGIGPLSAGMGQDAAARPTPQGD